MLESYIVSVMNTLPAAEFTIGQWRQAVTSFSILFPADQVDWTSRPFSEELMARHYQADDWKAFTGQSVVRNLVVTNASLDPLAAVTDLTALNAVSVYYRRNGIREGVVQTYVSREEHQDLQGIVDIMRVVDTAFYSEINMLDLDRPAHPRFATSPANTPLRQFLAEAGMVATDTERALHLISRAAHVITGLTADSPDIRSLFPVE